MSAIDEFLNHEEKRKEAFDPVQAQIVGSQFAGASGGDWRRAAAQMAIGSAITLGIGTAVGLGSKGIQNAYNKITGDINRARGFRSMLKDNPDLGEFDRAKIEKVYRALHKFNPDMASDPYVSGSFVKNVLMVGQLPAQTVQTLTTSYEQAGKTRQREALSAMGLPYAQGGMMLAHQVNAPYEAALREAIGRPGAVETARQVAVMQDKLRPPMDVARAQELGRLQGRAQAAGVSLPELGVSEARAQAYGTAVGQVMAKQDIYGIDPADVLAREQEEKEKGTLQAKMKAYGLGSAKDVAIGEAALQQQGKTVGGLTAEMGAFGVQTPQDLQYQKSLAQQKALFAEQQAAFSKRGIPIRDPSDIAYYNELAKQQAIKTVNPRGKGRGGRP